MAKFEHRFHDPLVPVTVPVPVPVRLPAWFATPATALPADEVLHWDWLGDTQDSLVEVTEFTVTDGFIEALFGVSARVTSGMTVAA